MRIAIRVTISQTFLPVDNSLINGSHPLSAFFSPFQIPPKEPLQFQIPAYPSLPFKLPPTLNHLHRLLNKQKQKTNSLLLLANLFQWPVPSRLQENPPEARHLVSSWQQRLPANLLQQPEVWRNPIVSGQELWLWEKSGSTKRVPSSWSASFPSKGSWEKLLRISRPISGSRAVLSQLFKKQPRLISWVSLRTQICVLFMPRGLQSCPRISSWLEGSGAKGLKLRGLLILSWSHVFRVYRFLCC